MSQAKGINKTALVVGLFAATVVAVGVIGCATSEETYSTNDVCEDDNGDNYCDNDGTTEVDSSHFVYIGGHKTYYKKDRYQSSYGSSGQSSSGGTAGTSSGTTNSGSSVKPPTSSSGSGQVITRGSTGSGVSSGKSGIGSSSSSSSS